MKNILFILILFALGLATPFALSYYHQIQLAHAFTPQNREINTTPPASALSAQVADPIGDVTKFGRDSTEYAPIVVTEPFLQGEVIKTAPTAAVNLNYPDFSQINLGSNAVISALNTNPSSFLLNQQSGIAQYQVISTTYPVSLKILHLLCQLNQATVTAAIDAQTIAFKVHSGSLTLAYEDDNYQTHLITVPSAKTIIYNDTAHTYKFVRYLP